MSGVIMRNEKGQFIKGHPAPKTAFKKGLIPWNKGKHWSEEIREKISQTKKIKKFRHSEENKKKISEASFKSHQKKNFGFQKENHPKTEFKKGRISNRKGVKHTEEAKTKMSKNRKGKCIGKNHPNWRGGISKEFYGIEFNKELKEQIRKRDSHKCRECGHSQEELGYKLHVHHIDYNKRNNSPDNLISLCRNCHAQTIFKREDWTKYFINKLSCQVN